MKKVICFLLMGILAAIGLAGCGVNQGGRGKDLQGLSQIEIYSSDGHLINTILDEEILSQFNDLNYADVPSDTDAEMDTLESKAGDLNVLYTIVS